MNRVEWPEEAEYASYYRPYVETARREMPPDTGPIDALRLQEPRLQRLGDSRFEARRDFRYALGKWTVAELIGHLSDSERVFAYRAMRIGRGDTTPLPGFDQDMYVAAGFRHDASLGSLADELAVLRMATILLFENMSEEAFSNVGSANEAVATPRALAAIMAGHVAHHLDVLEKQYGIVTSSEMDPQ